MVAIIGVLAAVGIPMYNGYIESSKCKSANEQFNRVRDQIQQQLFNCFFGSGKYSVAYNKTRRPHVNFYACSSGPRDYEYFARMMAEDFYQKDWKNPHAVSNNCCFSRRGKIATKASGLGTIYLNGIHSQKKVIISSNTCDAEPVRVTEVSF